MAMPNELVLVRHGHSEGNLATESARNGDESFYTPEFRERPGHRWRLTAEGREQARITGQWILKNIGDDFDRYYVSSYVRTRETAALLGLPNAQWRYTQRLRERDWGDIGSMPRREFAEQFPENAKMKEVDALYWRPPGGESIADVRLRLRNFFDTLHRECEGQKILVVTHGELMWSARAELEYMTDERWLEADKDPAQRIHNTQVLDYVRNSPDTGEQAKSISWYRSICPWMEGVDTGWNAIERHLFTNDDLLAQVESVDPLYSN